MRAYTYQKLYNSGFTLVELSVVIVVIMLLIAGVLSGQSMYKNSRLLAVTQEMHEYDIAVNMFKNKFKYYPGDFPHAHDYWPTAINGNGSWNFCKTPIPPATEPNLQVKARQFWYQLVLAGFVAGRYSGAAGPIEIGINIPQSSFATGGYDICNENVYNQEVTYLSFASLTNSCGSGLNGEILTPQDAYFIDQKIDDGIPVTGGILTARSCGYSGSPARCVSGDYQAPSGGYDPSGFKYLLDDEMVSCRVFWVLR